MIIPTVTVENNTVKSKASKPSRTIRIIKKVENESRSPLAVLPNQLAERVAAQNAQIIRQRLKRVIDDMPPSVLSTVEAAIDAIIGLHNGHSANSNDSI